jgi:hypothetical protein
MMSRKTDSSRTVKRLERSIRELTLDLKAITDEHDRYCWPTHEQAVAWFESLPIETLRESVERDHGKPRLHEKTQAQLEQKERDLREARYDRAIKEIERILGK